jgi:SAM-dependent methyltransferase
MKEQEWFLNERLWERTFDFMFPTSRFEKSAEEVAQILELVGHPVATALDVCCGPGRISVALAERGVRVTGVDASAFLLDKAKARADAADVAVEWVHRDVRTFERAGSFDLALNVFTSFGYFEDPEENLGLLRSVRRSLAPGGSLVMEVISKERLAHIWRDSNVDALPDGRLLAQRRRLTEGWARVDNEWLVLEDGRYESFSFTHHLYSGQELRRLLLDAGFGTALLYGGFDGTPFDGPHRIVAVAR